MQQYHYLGSLPKIGETIWYGAFRHDAWIALAGFSAAAWKCSARDRFIGWDFRHQYDRLKLVVNNSRFLILPQWHVKNLGSRILSLCQKRLPRDWQERFGHPVLLLETFVDPHRFRGTVYRAANWLYVGDTKGFRRTSHGYSATAGLPKMVFLKPVHPRALTLLSSPILKPYLHTGGPRIMLTAEQMLSLPGFFRDIPDPRRAQGRRHSLARFWHLPPVRFCVVCTATRPLQIGPKAWDQRHGSGLAADGKKAASSFPVNTLSGTCLSVLTPATWTRRCNAGMQPMQQKTKAWP